MSMMELQKWVEEQNNQRLFPERSKRPSASKTSSVGRHTMKGSSRHEEKILLPLTKVPLPFSQKKTAEST